LTKDISEIGNNEKDIGLWDIIYFLQQNCKQFIFGGIIGAIVGIILYVYYGDYTVQLNIKNNNTQINSNIIGLDLVTWRTLQKELPILANSMQINSKLSHDKAAFYKYLSEPDLWNKNITPIYTLSKADIKDFFSVPKETESNSTSILSNAANIMSFDLVVRAPSKNIAINNAKEVAHFIKSGGEYLQIKNMLNAYAYEVSSSFSVIKSKNSLIKNDQVYLKKRLFELTKLKKEFPNVQIRNNLSDVQIEDYKLQPIELELIAINREIIKNDESLSRNNDRLNQILVIQSFLDQAIPIINQDFDANKISKTLINIVNKLTDVVDPRDLIQMQVLDNIRLQLTVIDMRFSNGLDINEYPLVIQSNSLKWVMFSVMLVELLVAIFLVSRKFLKIS
jgi:hypothetical protein